MRWRYIVVGLVALVAATGVGPPPAARKLPPAERKKLQAEWQKLNDAGLKAYHAGKAAEATRAVEAALGVARRLYPKGELPDGHADLATSLNNLGALLYARGRLADAEPHLRDALAMRRRLFKGDHPAVAAALNNL